MSNRTYTKEQLDAALASMGVTDQTDVSRYGSGHINDTFKVETRRGVRYILQRVNTDIFPPELLKSNIVRVTEFLKSRGVKSLEVVGYENPWRLYAFLEGYTSVDLVTNPKEAELAAGAFATACASSTRRPRRTSGAARPPSPRSSTSSTAAAPRPRRSSR